MKKLLREISLLIIAAVAVWTILMSGGADVEESESPPPEIVFSKLPLTPEYARQCFEEMYAVRDRDAGQLWGVRLDAPMLFVDPQTRFVVADRADLEGGLKPAGDVYTGVLPHDVPIAGTVTEWAGRRWVMLPWPLPLAREERGHMLAHETFHYFQPDLNLAAPSPSNPHLDALEGRIWLQLEMRALQQALKGTNEQRRAAVADALLFRAHRHALFPEDAEAECVFEIIEGTAEFTGVMLGYGEDAVERALMNFEYARGWTSFVQSFAYVTGLAYCMLLEDADPEWRQGLSAESDLASMLAASMRIPTAAAPADRTAREQAALARARDYDYDHLTQSEIQRERENLAFNAQCRSRYIDGPVLEIPIQQMRFKFDPRTVRVLPGRGRVYPKMKMSDQWGVLEVESGALVAEDWTHVIVPAPVNVDARPLAGDGWRLELSPSWRVEPGDREGVWHLQSSGSDK